MGKSKTLSAFPLKHEQFPQIGDFPPFPPAFHFFSPSLLDRNCSIQGDHKGFGVGKEGSGKGREAGESKWKKIHHSSSHRILCSVFSFELDTPPPFLNKEQIFRALWESLNATYFWQVTVSSHWGGFFFYFSYHHLLSLPSFPFSILLSSFLFSPFPFSFLILLSIFSFLFPFSFSFLFFLVFFLPLSFLFPFSFLPFLLSSFLSFLPFLLFHFSFLFSSFPSLFSLLSFLSFSFSYLLLGWKCCLQ